MRHEYKTIHINGLVNTGSSKKMDGIWNRYNLKRTRRISFKQEIVSRVIFKQDGAPPHFSCFVTDVLNERFPDAWIGRDGPIPWPSRSPDLSPVDFFPFEATLKQKATKALVTAPVTPAHLT